MATTIILKTFFDSRGSLTVIDKELPFSIKRVYYIYGVENNIRGQHSHKKTIQAAIAIKGSCTISIQINDNEVVEHHLDAPNVCLVIEPSDFHWMHNFSIDCILLVLASENYDPNDYVYTN